MSDAMTIRSTQLAAHDAGFDSQFASDPSGDVRCVAGGHLVNPAALTVALIWRLEGASDVADLLLVTAVVCPRCGARGVLLLGYGPNATPADEQVLAHLDLAAAHPGPAPGDPPIDPGHSGGIPLPDVPTPPQDAL